jgi:hypothetical protein
VLPKRAEIGLPVFINMRNMMLRASKLAWPLGGCVLMLALLVNCGCSGINTTQSVSPLDFLLPGLHIQNNPPRPVIPAGTNVLVCWSGGVSPSATR